MATEWPLENLRCKEKCPEVCSSENWKVHNENLGRWVYEPDDTVALERGNLLINIYFNCLISGIFV